MQEYNQNIKFEFSLLTGWLTSEPHSSHVYVATTIIGFTSVVFVIIPLTVTNFPILSALISLTEYAFESEKSLKYTSLKITIYLCRLQDFVLFNKYTNTNQIFLQTTHQFRGILHSGVMNVTRLSITSLH